MSWLDSLHCQKKIIDRLIQFEDFKEFIKNYNSNLNLKGYLFLVEISINSFIHSTEFLITDITLYNMIHWGEPDLNRDEVREILRGNNKEVDFIRELEVIRKNISKIRLSKTINEIELKKIFENLAEKSSEIYRFYFENVKYKIGEKDLTYEGYHIIRQLFNVQNYVEHSFGLTKDFKEIPPKPLFIPGSFYTLMTSDLRKNYHLQNPLVEEQVYSPSYAIGLAWIYSQFDLDKTLIIKLINSKGWEDIHHNGYRIIDSYEKKVKNSDEDVKTIPDMFEDESKMDLIKKQIDKDKIDNIGELRIVFGDRELRTTENLHEGDYPVIHSIMEVTLFGLLHYAEEDSKLEIIEFKSQRYNGEETRYSYAFFLPVGGGLWNASEWLFFYDISVENSWETKCYFKERINKIIDIHKEVVDFKSYFVNEVDIKLYRKRKDLSYLKEIERRKETETSQGLLVELLGLFYYMGKNKEKISDFGWHVDPSNDGETDLDAYLIRNSIAEIIQAKKSIHITNPKLESSIEEIEQDSFNPIKSLKFEQDLKDIFDHFNKTDKIILEKAKKENLEIKKIDKKLFVFEKNEEEWIIDELRKYLSNKGIELTYFEDIENDYNIFPLDLIEKINVAFDRTIWSKNNDEE